MRRPFVLLALVSALASVLGGCSVSVPISPFESKVSKEDITGSIREPSNILSRRLDAEDWRRARAAMGTALDPQGNGSSVSWENAQSGSRGSFVPVAQTYPADDKICRAFLAKIETADGSEDLQGTACRDNSSDWNVRDAKPWRRT
jgi:surface antigen